MNKKEQYIQIINQYYEDEERRRAKGGRGDDWSSEEKFKERILSVGTVEEYLKELKNIILEKNDSKFRSVMSHIADVFFKGDMFTFKSDLLFEPSLNKDIKHDLIRGLKNYFTDNDANDFERLTVNERMEYLKKVDQVQGISTKIKEFMKLVKKRIEKFGNVQLPPWKDINATNKS